MPVADLQFRRAGQVAEQIGRPAHLEIKRRGVLRKPTVGVVGRVSNLAGIPQTDADVIGEPFGISDQAILLRHPDTHVHLLKLHAFLESRKRQPQEIGDSKLLLIQRCLENHGDLERFVRVGRTRHIDQVSPVLGTATWCRGPFLGRHGLARHRHS